MAEIAVEVTIEGRVQGVGFRAWVVDEASRHRLAGWVRNRIDGSVEARFVGETHTVEAMIEACRRGPHHAAVTRLARRDAPVVAADAGGGFNLRPTI